LVERAKVKPIVVLGLLTLMASGCVSSLQFQTRQSRPFDFSRDTFSFSNQTVYAYDHDPATGRLVVRHKDPPPDYTRHCFVVCRSAAQFFQYARFVPALPLADDATYGRLVRQVVSRSLSSWPMDSERIVIPGYPSLREFSRANERLLKAECGSALHSYVQRGHWRSMFWFSREQQAGMAKQLKDACGLNRPAIVHIVCYPRRSFIHHAILVYAVVEAEGTIRFTAYDPNNVEEPIVLTFDCRRRTFSLPPTDKFQGGNIAIYQIYHSWCY
jgi:hypothetical protein